MASSCKISVSEEGTCSLHVNSPGANQELQQVKIEECNPNDGAVTSLSIVYTDSEPGSFEEDSSKFEELSAAFAEVLQVEVFDELLSSKDISSDQCQRNSSIGNKGLQEVNALDTTNQIAKKRLEKSATFPCAETRNSSIDISSVLAAESHTCQDSGDSVLSKSEKALCTRSVSLPSALKLVSAMKGGREKQGLSPKTKQSVKWAPDVYDPPATSMSHTVKSHQQRPKSRKKDKRKNKHKGSRSPRGNANDKQRLSRNLSATTGPFHHIRLQAPTGRMLSDGFSYSGVQISEYATGSNESKCGSSFLVGLLLNCDSPWQRLLEIYDGDCTSLSVYVLWL